MNVFPGAKTAQVRSIQKHDDEFDSASEGNRVGLALKNVELGDLEQGMVLTTDPSIKATTSLKTHASLVKYWQMPIKSWDGSSLGSLDAVPHLQSRRGQ